MEYILEEYDNPYLDLIDNLPVGVYRTSPGGKIFFANQTIVNMLGYSSKRDLINKNVEVEGFTTPEEREKFKRLIEEDGEVKDLISIWTRKDKRRIYVMESSKPVHNSEHVIIYYEGIVQDITEQKKTEERLKQIEAHERAVIEAFDGLIYFRTENFILTFLNKYMIEYLGYDASGEYCYKALYELDKSCPWCCYDDVCNGKTIKTQMVSPKNNHTYYVMEAPLYHLKDSMSKQTIMIDMHEVDLAEITPNYQL
jgi:PAS domain S-box-containing protein